MSLDKSLEKSNENENQFRPDAFYRAPGHFLMEEIQALPYSDIPSALTLALQKLELVNRLHIDIAHREDAVRPFNFAWRKFHHYYAELRTTQKYVRQADSTELDQLGKFTRSLSYGYQLAIEGLLGVENQHSQKAQLFFNAIFYIGQAMLQSYARYSWTEPGLWQQLHHLYRSAELEKCEEIAVSTPLDSASKQSSKQLYAAITLLSVADPYHMQQGDVWLLQRYLTKWCHLIEVTAPDLQQLPEFCFCVNLYSQVRAFPLSSLKNYTQDGLRWIFVDKIEEQVKHHLNLIRNGHSSSILGLDEILPPAKSLDLLERALVCWAYTPSRQTSRFAESDPVGIVWTLNDIFRLLDANSRKDVEEKKQKLQLHHKAWGNTENSSESGVRVHIKQFADIGLSVGEVVGLLRNTATGQQLQIGIVQWTAQGESEQMLRCGIQFISGTPRAALVDLESHEMGVRYAILLVQENATSEAPNTLILPTGIASIGDRLLVSTPDVSDAFEIIPNKVLLHSDQIDHCSFETVNELV